MISLKKITLTRAVISHAFIFVSLTSAFAQVSLDSSFGNNGIVITPSDSSAEITCLAIQTDGKIVAAGYSLNIGGYHFQTARYNSDGTIDSSFGTGGIVTTNIGYSSYPYSIALQANGKIIVAGAIRANNTPPFEYHSVMVRYNTDGTLDSGFGIGGIVTTVVIGATIDDAISFILIQPDDKIVAGGIAGYQFLLMRYNTNGTLDNSFGSGGIVLTSIESVSSIYSIAIQNDGKITAAGTTEDMLSNSKFALARYNTDGTLDSLFDADGKVVTDLGPSIFTETCYSLALQADSKIVVSGFSGDKCALVRYDTDGGLDNSFGNAGIVVADSIPGAKGLAIQTDGKIIVSGNVVVTAYNYGYSLSRFNADGTQDNSFGNAGTIITDINTGNDYSQYLSLQPDGKIIVAGSSRASTSTPSSFTLIRFTSDLTGINDIFSSAFYWMIFPNPANNHLNIVLGSDNKKVEVTITDITGKIIYTTTATGKQKVEVNTKDFAEGVYIVQIHAADFIETKKLIVTK